ncbi:hypothetical protein N7492_007006 [Penicillium capsulatum]|uniref:BRCT domain-containing protein n=1 Tax=Penicillium capsulatum TaxID=69766 RepID=A0A9W9LL96_9EURO|nr:hypothetical protein N7492_007006 [Penicillium capsulatum]KAJ6116839.1 hypothetical protein N7512_006564 [Penicillium capsulatum]
MGKPFENVHACVAGKIDEGEKIPRWVRANGGQFHREVDRRCTHLITTKQAFKHNVEAVQQAKELGTVKIVSYEWLEDSLLSKSRRPKPEAPYLLETLTRPASKSAQKAKGNPPGKDTVPKAANKRIKDPFVKPKLKKGSKGSASDGLTMELVKFQISENPSTGEPWFATLIRAREPPALRDKYQLAIFETFTRPTQFLTYVKYSRVGVSKLDQLTPAKSSLFSAVTTFKDFFKLQTGKDWDDRDDGKVPPPKTNADGNILPPHEGWYFLEDTTSIFTKFIRETRPVTAESAPTPDVEHTSYAGKVDGVTPEDSGAIVGEESGNESDLESFEETVDEEMPACTSASGHDQKEPEDTMDMSWISVKAEN